jgi:hypothetical protein
MRSARIVVCVVGLAAGCGDDSGSTPNPPPTAAAAKNAANPAAAGAAKTQLPEKLHVEDRVTCAIPDKPSDPDGGKCDPKAPSCPEKLYCTTLASGSFCEPCPERDNIRHVFKERDFVAEQNRDPFEPGGTLITKGPSGQVAHGEKCQRDDQFVASSFSYVDLKLVGIIAQGTQRKVLMMGGPLGYIIKRGDCVGKEKAVVTDIGTGYITFQIDPDPLSTNQRPASEYSVQLNPKQLAANDPNEFPQSLPRTTIAPVVAPPVLPPSGARGTTVIVPGTAPAPGTVIAPASNITPATGAMAPGSGVPLVVPASPAAPGGSAAPSAPAPSVPARVFVPAPKR